MYVLFRFIPILLLIWLLCYSFYMLGKKNTTKGNHKKSHGHHRKKVDSTIVEEEKDGRKSKNK